MEGELFIPIIAITALFIVLPWIIFAGSSALSSRSVMLAATISRVRENMPMAKSSLLDS